MWVWIQQAFGNVTSGELGLLALVSLSIVMFSWAPRIGEALGAMFDPDDDST